MLSTVDGVFVLDRRGKFRRVASGQALAAGGRTVVHTACDDTLACKVYLTDVVSGERQEAQLGQDLLDLVPMGAEVKTSPDGRYATLVVYMDGGPRLYLLRLDDARVTPIIGGVGSNGTVTSWSPDSERVFWMDGSILVALDVATGEEHRADLGRGFVFLVAV